MSLSSLIRVETRPAHDRIELAFDLPARLVSRDSYRDLLVRLLGFHGAFEAAAVPHLAGTPFAAYFGRTSLIAADLDRLGGASEHRTGPSPDFADAPAAMGGLYVVEGSILGGVLIAAEVRRRLGIGPDTGAGFFAGHGRDTAATWRSFTAALDASPCPDPDRAVAAAFATYAAMQAWLCDAPVEEALLSPAAAGRGSPGDASPAPRT